MAARTEQRLLGLELLRFFASLAVLLYHYAHFAPGSELHLAPDRSMFPLYRWLWPFYEQGNYGVQVFFCISGYIFFRKYREPIVVRKVDARRFFWLRFSRLYPLYAATLVYVALLQHFFFRAQGHFFVYPDNDAYHFIKHALLVSNWGRELVMAFNGPSWSISIEVLVYAVFFVLLRYVSGAGWVNVLMLGGFVLAKALGVTHSIVDGIGYFYAGGVAAGLALSSKPLIRRLRPAAMALVIGLPLIVLGLGLQHRPHFSHLFLIVYCPLGLWATADALSLPPRAAAFVTQLGDLTYASYLLHFPVQLSLALGLAWSGQVIPYLDGSFLLLYASLTLGLAWLSYRGFEMPLQAWIRRRVAMGSELRA